MCRPLFAVSFSFLSRSAFWDACVFSQSKIQKYDNPEPIFFHLLLGIIFDTRTHFALAYIDFFLVWLCIQRFEF